eukprot:COSAG06_NODE_4789_length_3952_cov_2.284454_5_plen_51_part_00
MKHNQLPTQARDKRSKSSLMIGNVPQGEKVPKPKAPSAAELAERAAAFQV